MKILPHLEQNFTLHPFIHISLGSTQAQAVEKKSGAKDSAVLFSKV